MIEMIDIGIENAIAYRVGGKVTEDEMKSVLSVFRDKIKNGEKLLIYQEIVSVGGAEFDAIIEKLKFFSEFGLSNFSKIAVVTHKNWIHKIIDLEGKLFKKFDMKGFSIDDKDKALEFLKHAG
jgi:SpoIIAA-like